MEEKRVSCRAIIYVEGGIVSMYRERGERKFYTFPGGGKELNESEEECVKREVLEEFGLKVEPLKKVYVYESQRSIEHFYVCKWISGKFGSGVGEEFQADRNNGIYKPTTIEIAKIPQLPLMPPEVAENFVKDYKERGEILNDSPKYVLGEIK